MISWSFVSYVIFSDNIGSPTSTAPKLLAHEFGHLLGAEHDGVPSNQDTIFGQKGTKIPCQEGTHLMSPAVSKYILKLGNF